MAVEVDTYCVTYSGNNSTVTPYQVPFPFLDGTHLTVRVKASGGSWVTISSSQYVVTRFASGLGTVRITSGVVPTSSQVMIKRRTPLYQTTVFPEAGPFPAKSAERMGDRAIMALQERTSPYFDPSNRPTVTGSRGGNAALASLLTALATNGFIINGTSA